MAIDLMVKPDRPAVQAHLVRAIQVVITITGGVGGSTFLGVTTYTAQLRLDNRE